MKPEPVHSSHAPKAIGPYSQAMRAGNTLYLSGQIPLDPATGEMVGGDFEARARRVLDNLKAVCSAAGCGLDRIVKINVYLTDLSRFATVNEVMAEYFAEPYPARAAVQVTALPKNASVEMDAIAVLDDD